MSFETGHILSVAEGKVWGNRIATTDVYRRCVAIERTRGHGLETSPKPSNFRVAGFKFTFGRNKKGKVLKFLVI